MWQAEPHHITCLMRIRHSRQPSLAKLLTSQWKGGDPELLTAISEQLPILSHCSVALAKAVTYMSPQLAAETYCRSNEWGDQQLQQSSQQHPHYCFSQGRSEAKGNTQKGCNNVLAMAQHRQLSADLANSWASCKAESSPHWWELHLVLNTARMSSSRSCLCLMRTTHEGRGPDMNSWRAMVWRRAEGKCLPIKVV